MGAVALCTPFSARATFGLITDKEILTIREREITNIYVKLEKNK